MIGRSFLQSGWEQTQASFFRSADFWSDRSQLTINSLSGSPATFSFAFSVTVDMQVGQANVFSLPVFLCVVIASSQDKLYKMNASTLKFFTLLVYMVSPLDINIYQVIYVFLNSRYSNTVSKTCLSGSLPSFRLLPCCFARNL